MKHNMKRLVCEMCGSQDLVKQDGVFVCQNCGTKYSVEDAKKMMTETAVTVEGTVAVEGTVKVDKSEELKKLYTLAHRAKDADNIENAVRYYTEIEMQDPNSWEAYFYLIYFKARDSQIRNIPIDCKNLSNCFSTTFDLMKQYYGNDKDKVKEAVTQISKDIKDITEIILNAARSISDVSDQSTYYSCCLNMMESFGDQCLKADYPDLAKDCWITEVELILIIIWFGTATKNHYQALAKSNVWTTYNYDRLVSKIYQLDYSYIDPMGITKKLSKNEKFITCPKCGIKIREREPKCPHCGTPKDEITKLLKEQEARDAADRERQRKEAAEKAAEEKRKREEERKEWWRKNGKKVRATIIAIVLLIILAALGVLAYFAINKHIAEQKITEYFAAGDSCVAVYKFDEAKQYYNKAYDFSTSQETISRVNAKQRYRQEAQTKADEEYDAALRRLKILLEADDYQFNQYSNECLDKMILIHPDRKETIYYQNLRK